jgi:hypothetical protein
MPNRRRENRFFGDTPKVINFAGAYLKSPTNGVQREIVPPLTGHQF